MDQTEKAPGERSMTSMTVVPRDALRRGKASGLAIGPGWNIHIGCRRQCDRDIRMARAEDALDLAEYDREMGMREILRLHKVDTCPEEGYMTKNDS